MARSEVYNDIKKQALTQKARDDVYGQVKHAAVANDPNYYSRINSAANNVQDWLSRYNGAFSGLHKYEKEREDKWEPQYGGEWYDQLQSVANDYDKIRSDAERIGFDHQSAFGDIQRQIGRLRKNREYMSQFESDDAYQLNKKQLGWLEQYKDTDHKALYDAASKAKDNQEKAFLENMAAYKRQSWLLNMDIQGVQSNIESLKQERSRLEEETAYHDWNWQPAYERMTLEEQNAAEKKQQEKKNRIQEIDRQIRQMELEQSEAQRVKNADALYAVSVPEDDRYDPAFREKSRYQGDSNIGWGADERSRRSWFINMQNGENARHRKGYYKQNDHNGYSYYKNSYDMMEPAEVALFNYWDNYDQKNGTNKAQEFLDSIQEVLNSRRAVESYESLKDSTPRKALAYLGTGFQSGVNGIVEGGKKLISGSTEYTPASAEQIAASMLLQDARENGTKMGSAGKYSPANIFQDEEGGRTWEEFAGQGLMSIGNMIPSISAAYAVGGLAGMAGLSAGAGALASKVAGSTVMGAGIAGNTYAEAINEGYNAKTARTYAYAAAASEIGTELLLGGVEGMTGVGTDALSEALLKKTDNAILRAGVRGVTDGFGEALEEGIQAIIEPWIDNVILHKESVLRGQDVAYSMLAGFATSYAMSGPNIVASEASTAKTGRDALRSGLNTDTLRAIAESFNSDTDVHRLAGKIDKNTDAYTIGRLLHEIDSGLTQQNVHDIADQLVKMNLPRNVAERNAWAINYVATHEDAPQELKLALYENTMLADAVRAIMSDSENVVTKRNQNVRDLYKTEETVKAETGARDAARQRILNGDAAISNPNRNVLAVVSREGDTMQLKLKDGRTVDSSDATIYRDEAEALLFDTARRMSTDVESANLIANGIEGSDLSVEEYVKGISDAYRYGEMAIPQKQLSVGSVTSKLDWDAAAIAYDAGLRKYVQENRGKVPAGHERAEYKSKDAKVYYDRNKKYTEKQKSAISTMKMLSKVVGIDFYTYESKNVDGKTVYQKADGSWEKAPNGWYDKKGIHIDINAGNNGNGLMLFTLAHELTHHIQATAPEKFDAFAGKVVEGLASRGIDFETLVAQQIKKAADNGRNIDYITAYEEMVADSMEQILQSGRALEKLQQIMQTDQELGSVIRRWAKGIAESIRNVIDAYRGVSADSDEGRLVANMKDILPQLEELYAEGLAESGKNGAAGTESAAMREKMPSDRGEYFETDKYFERQIDNFENLRNGSYITVGKIKKGSPINAVGIPEGKLYFDVSKILQEMSIRKDAIPKDVMKKIPRVLDNPIVITEFTDRKGKASISVYGELFVGNSPVVVGIVIGKHRNGISVDKVQTVHPNRNFLSQFTVQNTLYINPKKKETNTWFQALGAQMPLLGGTKYGFIRMVSQSNDNVKKFSDRDQRTAKENAALKRENAQLRDALQYAKDLVKLQGKVTDGTVYTRGSVEAVARQILKGADIKVDQQTLSTLTKILERTYRAIGEGSSEMMAQIDEAANWILDNKPEGVPKRDAFAQTILDDIRKRSISLNAEQKSEAAYLCGSYGDYRKGLFGSITISDKANTSLDQFWHEMSSMYPNKFPEDINSSDMPRALFELVGGLKDSFEMFAYDPKEIAAHALDDQRFAIYERFTDLIPIKTVADKNKVLVDKLKAEYRASISKIRAEYKKTIADIQAQHKAGVEAAMQTLNQHQAEKQADFADSYRRQIEDAELAGKNTELMEREFLILAKKFEESAPKERDAKSFDAALRDFVRQQKKDSDAWSKAFVRLSREYEALGRNADKLQQKLDQTRATASARVESRKQTAVRNQILDIHSKLRKMIVNPGKRVTQHAPASLLNAVAEVCDLFTQNQMQAGQRKAEQYDAKIDSLQGKNTKTAQAALDAANRQKERIANTAQKLQNMRLQYETLKKGNSIYYNEHTAQMLSEVSALLSGKDIYEMSSQELGLVKNAMKNFYHSIVKANKIHLESHDASLIDTAIQWGREINDTNIGYLRKFLPGVGRHMNWQMSPDTFFSFLSGYAKDNVGEKVQKMFQRGTEREISVQREYYNLFAPITENKKNLPELRKLLSSPTKGMVDIGLKDANGDPVKLSRGFALQLYMLMNQSDSLEAMVYSGLKIPDQRMYYKDKSKAMGDTDIQKLYTPGIGEDGFALLHEINAAEADLAHGDFGSMTEAQMQAHLEDLRLRRDQMVLGEEYRLSQIRENLEKMMTPMERELADKASQWYRRSGELMADAFEEVHGYRPPLVDGYVPMHRDGTTIKTDIRENGDAFNLENSGFLKERIQNTNAIVLTDFFSELAGQRDSIARYYGFVQAQADFNRLWKIRMPGMGKSINAMVAAKYGTGNTRLGVSGVEYVENYIKDIGGRSGQAGIFDFFYGAAASSTLSLNPRVALSQLASIPTAAAVVGWKNMGVGFVKGLETAMSSQKRAQLAQDNVYFFQRYRGDGGITEIADLQNNGTLWGRIAKSKAGKAMLNWCQNMDVFATSTMWAMAEEAVKAQGIQKGSEGYHKAVNDMYTDIIRKTQPNYTTTERSDLLRDKRAGTKILSMYKTQPNQNLNILMQSSGKLAKMYQDFHNGKNGVTRADVKKAAADFANASTAVIIGGNVMFVLVRTGVNLAMAQVAGYRDDDTGEVTSEAIRAGMFKEFLSSMAGMFTLGGVLFDAVYSVASGDKFYGMSDTSAGMAADLWNRSVQLIGKVARGEAKFSDYEALTGELLQSVGVPYKNAKRFMDAYHHWAANIENGSLMNYSDAYTKPSQFRNRALKAYLDGDEEKLGDALAILYSMSDAPTDRRIQSDIRSGFRDSFKEKFLRGEVAEETVRAFFTDVLDADRESIDRMIASWRGQVDTGMTKDELEHRYLKSEDDATSEDYIRYLMEFQGKSKEEAEKAELRLRCERDTGYSYDEIKDAYIGGEISESQIEKWMQIYGGVEDSAKRRKEYDFEAETGYNWYDRKEAYISGGISREDLKSWIMDIEGKRSRDADAYIDNLDFEDRYGFGYNRKLEAYIAGDITSGELKQILMEKGRMYEQEAERELVAYDYIKAHPDTQLGISAAYSYTRTIANSSYTLQSCGLTEAQYLDFAEKKAQCNGTDLDGDGRRDSGSVQAQLLPIIDAMPISEQQKDTLWYFCGWSKRTLNKKAPWKQR